jgi:hypothetical protein
MISLKTVSGRRDALPVGNSALAKPASTFAEGGLLAEFFTGYEA